MYCPFCRSTSTRVVDSRVVEDGRSVRRRRECENCENRFSTIEEMELLDVIVLKQDGKRELYARHKLEKGIVHSLRKRPYTHDRFLGLIYAIECDIQAKRKREITSKEIGEIVMENLRDFDKVAYIRFASIYRAFEDVSGFEDVVQSLQKNHTKDIHQSDTYVQKETRDEECC